MNFGHDVVGTKHCVGIAFVQVDGTGFTMPRHGCHVAVVRSHLNYWHSVIVLGIRRVDFIAFSIVHGCVTIPRSKQSATASFECLAVHDLESDSANNVHILKFIMM